MRPCWRCLPTEAAWTVPLGLAVADGADDGPVYLDTLRPGRADRALRPRRVWLQPEDDVPHIRDRLARGCDAVGLRPVQLAVAPSVAAAAADVLSGADACCARPRRRGNSACTGGPSASSAPAS